MIKKITGILLFSIFISTLSLAQEKTEKAAIRTQIQKIFDGMRAGDSALVHSVFHPGAHMYTTFTDDKGIIRTQEGDLQKWLTQIGTPHNQKYDEKIWSYDIRIDGGMASAWTEYSFFLGDRLLHCGVNAFHLVKTNEGWKVLQITDTRRRENCVSNEVENLGAFINAWHKAAAIADAGDFFGRMTEDAVYIGTEAGERWLRDELRKWAKASFEGESAWDFKSKDRQIYFSNDEKFAWWEEKLDTWMGVCHGSGVAQKYGEGWKIRHYHLSVTVPNDKIREFKALIKD